MKRIAVYGKGGIGKSTAVSNIAAVLAGEGLCVMQIGCDPKADSTGAHLNGGSIKTVLNLLREKGDGAALCEMVHKGEDGVLCVECGGPIPGTGCAGRGIVTAFEALAERDAYSVYKPDVLLYDVLGDVVCGGFAMPLRHKYARDVFIVTSGEKMSLYAAANIALALENFKGRGYARLTGLIQNSRLVAEEKRLVLELAAELNVPLTGIIPREELIQEAENMGSTLVAAFPHSDTAAVFRNIAAAMMDASEDAEDE